MKLNHQYCNISHSLIISLQILNIDLQINLNLYRYKIDWTTRGATLQTP